MKRILILSLLMTAGLFAGDNKKFFTPEQPEIIGQSPDPDFNIPSSSSSSSSSSSLSNSNLQLISSEITSNSPFSSSSSSSSSNQNVPPISSETNANSTFSSSPSTSTQLPEGLEQLHAPEVVIIDFANIGEMLELLKKHNLSSAELRTLHDGITVMTEIIDMSTNQEVKRINLELARKRLADETAHFLIKTGKQTVESAIVGGGAAFGQTIGSLSAKLLFKWAENAFFPDEEAIMQQAIAELQLKQAQAKITNDEAAAIKNRSNARDRETASIEAQIEATKELLALTIQLQNLKNPANELQEATA